MSHTKRIVFSIIGVVLVGVVVFLSIPSNYYVGKALTNGFPKIDQYPIFENRVVRATNPEPWNVSTDYGKYSIDTAYLDDFEKFGTVSYLVVRNDSVLFEKYWEGYDDGRISNSFSMAKSVISLLIGAAIDEGLIKNVKQSVIDFLPEYGSFGGKELTVEDLLTMSAGVDWQESYAGLFSPVTQGYYGNDLPSLISGMEQIEQPGVMFRYQSGVTMILGRIVEVVTGKTISEYASEKLWSPMGAEHDALWSLDRKEGTEKSFCCFNSNVRDFARFGQLILNDGKWNGVEVISKDYIKNATTPAGWLISEDSGKTNVEYGYQFWILKRNGMTIPYMRGIYGQYVFAIPDLNMVVVRLGHNRSDERTDQHYPTDIDTWIDAAVNLVKN